MNFQSTVRGRTRLYPKGFWQSGGLTTIRPSSSLPDVSVSGMSGPARSTSVTDLPSIVETDSSRVRSSRGSRRSKSLVTPLKLGKDTRRGSLNESKVLPDITPRSSSRPRESVLESSSSKKDRKYHSETEVTLVKSAN